MAYSNLRILLFYFKVDNTIVISGIINPVEASDYPIDIFIKTGTSILTNVAHKT